MYSVVLVSSIQPCDSVIRIFTSAFFFRFFSVMGCYKIQRIVPHAIRYVLGIYLFYIQ